MSANFDTPFPVTSDSSFQTTTSTSTKRPNRPSDEYSISNKKNRTTTKVAVFVDDFPLTDYPLPLPESYRVTILFPSGNQEVYDYRDLCKKFNFFEKMFKGNFIESSSRMVRLDYDEEMFKIIFKLFIEKKNLFKVITDESFENIHIYEDLSKAYYYFAPKEDCLEGLTTLEKIHRQLSFMTLSHAQSLVAAYERQQLGEMNLPEAVKKARFTIKSASTLFHKGQYDELTLSLRYYHKRKDQLNEKIDKLQTKIDKKTEKYSKTDQHKNLQNVKVEDLLDQLKALSRDKNEILSKISDLEVEFSNKSAMMQNQHLVDYINDPANYIDSETRLQAEKAQSSLETYKNKILSVLESSGADMERKDLLEYLVGPKAFLLDTYGIVPNPNGLPPSHVQTPFVYVKDSMHMIVFGYDLYQDGPFHLEDEIRNDFNTTYRLQNLPKRIVKTNEFTVIDSQRPEVVVARRQIVYVMEGAYSRDFSEDEAARIKEIIIKYNKLDDYGITVYDLTITGKTTTTKIEGCLTNNPMINFHVNTGNCKLIIDNHTIWQTHDILKRFFSTHTVSSSSSNQSMFL